ncbi:hypothetical protein [Prescottella equi]|uniref:hypothetical protein n=1 Tax=Rhodococcus hoagii TaxID=43767 RepID=UPI0021D48C66|nr:hypothetical protein [Prescottella equi]MCU7527390.1 hypothetical protein [Prescottella equi]
MLRPAYSRTGTIAPVIAHTVAIVDGHFTMTDLDPGPAVLEISMGSWVQSWDVSIPSSDEPISFATLLDNYSEHEPGVVSETRANADRAEASAVRSESGADRAETAEQYVQGVVADGAAAVRAEVSTDAADARTAAIATAADRAATGEDRAATGADRTATENASSDARSRAEAATVAQGAAEDARDDANEHRQAAETAAQTAEEHEGAARSARAGAESAAGTAAADAASIVTTALQQAVAADRQAAETARAGAESAASTAATDTATQVTTALQQAVASDRQAAEAARGGAETAATAAAGHEDAAEGFAGAADASAQAADTARQLAEAAAEHAQTGAPAGGWLRQHFAPDVQDALSRADNALTGVPAATDQARGGIKITGVLAGTAESPDLASGSVAYGHLAEAVTDDIIKGVGIANLAEFHGGWPYETMTAGVKASLDKADRSYEKPTEGIPRADLDSATQQKIADAYVKPPTGIPAADIQTGAIDSSKIADNSISNGDVAPNAGIAFSKLSGIPFEMIIVHSSGTRKLGDGDLLVGEPLPRACTIDSVLYQFGTKDASGSTAVALLKNSILITGTNLTVTAANQVDGTATDGARTAMATANNVFAQNDRLAVTITSLGTTPGKVLKAVIRGRYT